MYIVYILKTTRRPATPKRKRHSIFISIPLHIYIIHIIMNLLILVAYCHCEYLQNSTDEYVLALDYTYIYIYTDLQGAFISVCVLHRYYIRSI